MKTVIIFFLIVSNGLLYGSGWDNIWPDTTIAGSPKNIKFMNDYGVLLADVNVILTTTNRGETWEINKYEPGEEVAFSEVSIISESISYAVGWRGYIIKTEDGGKNWVKLSSPFVEYYSRVDFIDENNGWVSSFNKLIKTTNAGQSWNEVNQPLKNIYDQHFTDENTGFICGESNSGDGELYITNDAGQTWELKHSEPNQILTELFLKEEIMILAGNSGNLFLFDYDNENWSNLGSSLDDYITSVFFINENVGWASTWSLGKVFRTTNGGLTWENTYKSVGDNDKIFDIHFFNENEGFAVGNNQVILKTETGGLEITTVLNNNSISYVNVYPIPSNNKITLSSSYNLPLEFKITNLQGEILLEGLLDTKQEFEIKTNFDSGTYFLNIKGKNYRETKKIIISK
jgi:photosystem II stability/assembly factor-like uncharacterized protein